MKTFKHPILIVLLLLIFPLGAMAKDPWQEETPATYEVPIIMYHKVTRDKGQVGKFAIGPEALEADFLYLQNSDFTPVLMADLIAFVHQGSPLPEKPIVLSFDDGYFGDYHYVYPLVQEYQIPVVCSIIGKTTDDYTTEGRQDIIYPHVTWPQVEEMAQSGLIEIQNHGYNIHHGEKGVRGAQRRRGESDAQYKARLENDLGNLQDKIKAHTGQAPSTFTYPFGAKSPGTDEILKELGFLASFMTEGRRNTITHGQPDCLYSLGRIIRPHGRSLEEILS